MNLNILTTYVRLCIVQNFVYIDNNHFVLSRKWPTYEYFDNSTNVDF